MSDLMLAIEGTVHLRDTRDTVRRAFGENYGELMEKRKTILRAIRAAKPEEVIPAAMGASKASDGMAAACWLAALCDALEEGP